MRLLYFSYKQVNHDYLLLRAYAIIYGRFNITVNYDYLNAQNQVNLPVFVYNVSHLSLKLLYASMVVYKFCALMR